MAVCCGGSCGGLGQYFGWSEWQNLNLRPTRPERGALGYVPCKGLRSRPGDAVAERLHRDQRDIAQQIVDQRLWPSRATRARCTLMSTSSCPASRDRKPPRPPTPRSTAITGGSAPSHRPGSPPSKSSRGLWSVRRMHGIGQEKPVKIVRYLLEGSLDAIVVGALARKVRNSRIALNQPRPHLMSGDRT
jgi:hypothetical protein